MYSQVSGVGGQPSRCSYSESNQRGSASWEVTQMAHHPGLLQVPSRLLKASLGCSTITHYSWSTKQLSLRCGILHTLLCPHCRQASKSECSLGAGHSRDSWPAFLMANLKQIKYGIYNNQKNYLLYFGVQRDFRGEGTITKCLESGQNRKMAQRPSLPLWLALTNGSRPLLRVKCSFRFNAKGTSPEHEMLT